MKIQRIIKAKVRDKNNLPEYFHKRKSICEACVHNTKNIDNLSLKDKFRVAHNLGKDACVKCTCGIEDKASDPIEQCPLTNPKWYAEEKASDWKHTVENNSKSKVEMLLDNKNKKVIFNYGSIEYRSDTNISFNVIAENINNFDVKASCGCTIPKYNKIDGGYEIGVYYNSSILGYFEKNITITINENKYIITIKGNVYRK